MTTKKELPGATLIIKNSKGKTVEKWVSTNEPHMIEKLPVGDYTLTEITAPAGYAVSETIKFTVTDTDEIQYVVMYDAPTPPVPRTGDNFNPVPVVVAVVVVIGLLGVAFVLIRKKRR